MATMKTLLIRPADVSLRPLGGGSPVADAQVSVSYDRDVAVDGGLYAAGGVPLVETSVPVEGLRVPVLVNDDPAITTGAGFAIVVTIRYAPRRGFHGLPVSSTKRITVTSADADTVPLAAKGAATALPSYGENARPSGVALWTDPDTGERVPYLTAPSSGTLTTIGAA